MATDRLLADRFTVIRLFDAYARLLTPRQQQLVALYFHDDLSLSEIAERLGVTRQAIHDSLRRSLAELVRYEELLGLVQRARGEDRRRQLLLQELDALEGEIRRTVSGRVAQRLLARVRALRELL
ncbi:MAG: sigma factor-like helix-turn-helix DNA-binding protein [Armatimonadota bacterium]|nr:sigma factor-like helix-turn-helix DNA-binding protein [Armatimonadota bacterium]MDR5677038.1 sigma factor-like helix-turn-helix DNA-binding protein [Armatimonadota bacterium]MDR5689751.1 sigma factor-like helix-turn-helix DNA-binding protein [Armatimonadota bacterium]MDR7386794.1 sigma factor-like helix-turn-helix DNA-binding protein [Armatimonadota bacterium]MDR7389676.1 sigma factor-like helix-turn-helix DNA-binding protein [Armatimonadota bacterium]